MAIDIPAPIYFSLVRVKERRVLVREVTVDLVPGFANNQQRVEWANCLPLRRSCKDILESNGAFRVGSREIVGRGVETHV